MTLTYRYLFDEPQLTGTVVRWWNEVWPDVMGPDLPLFEAQLLKSLSNTKLPLLLVAYMDGVPIGTAALKLHELESVYPDNHYWLGSVFVDKNFRGSQVASSISMHIVALARQRGFPHLYLQTLDLTGGLYAKLGWEAIEQFHHQGEDALLMIKYLD